MRLPPAIHHERLPNGLTVLMVPRLGGVVTVDAWIGVGSADETPELNGVSHFLEHMLFKGAGRYGPGEIDRVVEGVGGMMNAGTSHDFTHCYVTAASENFPVALDVVAAVIENATLDPDELDRERQVILEEYARKQDDPHGVLWETLYDRAFATGPYKAPVLGVPESLEAIGRPEMLDYYCRHYAPENVALLVVGDIEPPRALEAVGAALSGFHRPFQPLVARGGVETTYCESVETVLEKDVNETYGVMAFPVPALKDCAAAYARDVLQFLLGCGDASLLYQEIKEKRRLATSIQAGCGSSRYPDLFYVCYTCDEAKRPDLEKATLEQIDRVAQAPPAPQTLERARRLLANAHAFSLETTNGESAAIGYYYTVTGATRFERDYTREIANVSAERVQEQAQRCLKPETMTRVAVRPKQAGAPAHGAPPHD